MATLFIPNPDFEDDFLAGPDAAAATLELAERTIAIAEETAPVDEGDYLAGLTVDDRGDGTAAAVAEHWSSGFVEFGTEDTPPHATLRRAAEAAVR